MPRVANSVIARTSEPGTLSRCSTTLVRSLPVRAGAGPGSVTSTNLVRAPS